MGARVVIRSVVIVIDRINVLKEGGLPVYTLPYVFKAQKTIVIEHHGASNIATNNDGVVKTGGGMF